MIDRKELTKFIIPPCLDLGTDVAYPFDGKLPEGVVGVDTNPKLPNVIKQDVTQGLPFPDKSFNTITAFEIFEHITPEKRDFLIEEIKRVAKLRVIISVPDKNDKRTFPTNSNPKGDWANYDHYIKDWLFSKEEAIELAKKISEKFELFEIENPVYKGYGLVCELSYQK
jgi:ubiquinone/menaquinone biosynthesis C-methylase UbiE